MKPEKRRDVHKKASIGHGAMPLEVGGALRFRLEAQGDLGHMPSASLGQDAALSFVVRGRGHGAMPLEVGGALRLRLEAEGRFEILDWRLWI